MYVCMYIHIFTYCFIIVSENSADYQPTTKRYKIIKMQAHKELTKSSK